MAHKTKQRSWGKRYEEGMKAITYYTKCPTCGYTDDDKELLFCIVGYSKEADKLIIKCPKCRRFGTIHGYDTTFEVLENTAKYHPQDFMFPQTEKLIIAQLRKEEKEKSKEE